MKPYWPHLTKKAAILLVFYLLVFTQDLFTQQPKLMLPIGHTDGVRYAQFSPDGKRVVTASFDKSAKLWEAETGLLLADLKGHTDVVNMARFSPDGKKILTVSGSLSTISQDKSVRIWDATSGLLLGELKHDTYVVSAQFSPDGKKILTVARDKAAYIWDASSFKLTLSLNRHTDVVNSAQYSPDGKKIITGSADKTAIIWEAATGKFLKELKGKLHHVVNAAQFSPDMKKILTIHRNSIARVWDAVADTVLYELWGVSTAQFNPDGTKIVSCSFFNIGVVWDAVTGKPLFNLTHDYPVVAVQFNPDGKRVVTGSYDHIAKIWDIDSQKLVMELEGHDDWILSAQFSKDGKKLVTASTDGTAIVWSVGDGKLLSHLKGHAETIATAQISGDEKKILTASYDGSAKIWDAKKGTLLLNIPSANGLLGAEFSSDGNKIVIASSDSVARIHDGETGDLLGELKAHQDWVLSAQFSPDGKKIVTGSKDRTAIIWDANADTVLVELKGHGLQVNSAQFSPDGKYIVTASNDKTARMWNAATGTGLKTFSGHNYFVTSAQFSPDGKKIVTASWDKTIKIWNADTGDSIATLKAHSGYVHTARFSNDGKKIISASEDGTVKIWDANTYKLIDDLLVDPYGVNTARFSDDGKEMIMTCWSNTFKLWNAVSKKNLFTIIPVDSIDYLVADSSYRYDGTQAARNLLYFTCGTEIIELSQVKDQLWVPGLAEQISNNESISSKTLYQLGICGYTPETNNSIAATGEYRFKIKPRGGGLGETVVSVNGIESKRYKPDEIKNRNGEFEVVIKKNEIDSLLVPGQENAVTVRSFAKDNSIVSRGAEVTVENTSNNKQPSNLYAVMVGINDYKGDSIDLNFAAKDANDLATILGIAAKKYLNDDGKEHVFIYKLTSFADRYKVPDKKSIKAVLDTIGKKAKANDMLLIFFAGHGTMMGTGSNQQFYFLTSEANSLKATNALKNVSISTAELMEWMKPQKIKAQKRVLIFDACSSGQAIADFARTNFANQSATPVSGANQRSQQIKTIDKLNEKSGFFILSASASGKDAYEIPKFSQGLLTYSLLRSVKMNPEVLESSRYLNIGRWFTVAEKIVTELIKENGAEQEPQLVSNNNFSVGVVDDEVISKINLPIDKPLFAASNFQNSNDTIAYDDMELSKLVNLQLNNIAARGGTNKITYVTATNSPDAYTMSGRYAIAGSSIKVSVNIIQNSKIKTRFEVSGDKNKLNDLTSEIAGKAAEWAATTK